MDGRGLQDEDRTALLGSATRRPPARRQSGFGRGGRAAVGCRGLRREGEGRARK